MLLLLLPMQLLADSVTKSFHVKVYGRFVQLGWTASISTGVIGYNIYRGTIKGGPYTKITNTPVNALTYTDTPPLHATYYYVVTAVTSTAESGNSNEGTATVK